MFELKEGAPIGNLADQIEQVNTGLSNSGSALSWSDGQRYLLGAIETLDRIMSHAFVDSAWIDRLYSNSYWAIRDMSGATPRPMPLLSSEANRLERWLDELVAELQRIAAQDEWDESNLPRVVLDTSALVREGNFDQFNWATHLGVPQVRLIIPILVVRELDGLKNSGRNDKARPRLRKLMRLLESSSRGPVKVPSGAVLELLMDPPGHVPYANNDQEILRRATYLPGRRGGPLRVVTGDYTMLFTARAAGLTAELTPEELVKGDGDA